MPYSAMSAIYSIIVVIHGPGVRDITVFAAGVS